VIRLEHLLSNAQRISIQCFRRLVIAEFAFHNGEAGERGGDIDIFVALGPRDRKQTFEDVRGARILRPMNVQPPQLVQQRGECGVFPTEELLADGQRFGEKQFRFRFPGPAELPRELPELEQGGGELQPETRLAARYNYCRVKGLGGGGFVPRGQRGARCSEPLGKQRFRVGHMHTVP
jgi:hypothetical protein